MASEATANKAIIVLRNITNSPYTNVADDSPARQRYLI
jgi:hypothetical protein